MEKSYWILWKHLAKNTVRILFSGVASLDGASSLAMCVGTLFGSQFAEKISTYQALAWTAWGGLAFFVFTSYVKAAFDFGVRSRESDLETVLGDLLREGSAVCNDYDVGEGAEKWKIRANEWCSHADETVKQKMGQSRLDAMRNFAGIMSASDQFYGGSFFQVQGRMTRIGEFLAEARQAGRSV